MSGNVNQLRVVQRRREDFVYGGLVYIIEKRIDADQLPWNDDYPWRSVYILIARDGYTLADALDLARTRHSELVSAP